MDKIKKYLGLSAVAIGMAMAPEVEAGSWKTGVTAVEASANQTVTVKGNVSTGKTIDLTWASKSSMACFPATENVNFQGNHVMFGTQIPKQSEMVITVVPDDPKVDLSLYAYQVGSTDFTHIAPDVSSATSCEAGYDAQKDSNPGKSESVKLTATTNPYNVVIGVAGVKGVTSGGFTLKVELKTAAAAPTGKITSATLLEPTANQTFQVDGKIDGGTQIALNWASNSSVACFPATENANFEGKHVLYRVAMPAHAEMTISAVPKDSKTDISLYAYQVGSTDTTRYPDKLSSAVSCEAGYDAKKDSNPGVTETVKLTATTNPYAVYIGVAGAKGVTTGSFTLKIDLKTASSGATGSVSSATPMTLSNGSAEVSGKLDGGVAIPLTWAANSSVACFPATENANFEGNHVVYSLQMPAYSEMTVTATPKDSKTDVSVYAYQVGTTSTSLPPNVSSVVSCEAGYDKKNDSNPGVAESLKLTSVKNPYNVFIGVAGAKGVSKGDFTLKVQVKTK